MTTRQKYGNGPVPEGWRWVRLGELLRLEYGFRCRRETARQVMCR